MMGDNRNDSFDSRFQNGGGINGVVPESDVIGMARTIIWPPDRWRGVGENNPQVVSSLGAPVLARCARAAGRRRARRVPDAVAGPQDP